ncbi:MAG: hypothetical protein IPP44_29515 [Ideonella sp.]|nr:hypothetical protein [Ideonella sp.]
MVWPLCPTMMDDRIGSIGSTQGVNDSSSPASANTPATASRLRERSTPSKRPGSSEVAAAGSPDGLADDCWAAAPGAAAVPASSATASTFSAVPVAPPGVTSKACVCGG